MQPHKRELRNFFLGGKDVFGAWLGDLKDAAGRAAIHRRLDRVENGNFGPGYRVYYGEDGQTVVLLLCGGDKGTQWRDIQRAQKLWGAHLRAR